MICCHSSSSLVRIKLVIVGDGACGKTSLLNAFVTGEKPKEYMPTIFENSVKCVNYKRKTVELSLWDTAGQEGYDVLRTLAYPDANVVVIAFSVDSAESLDNVCLKWAPEVSKYGAGLPVLLVACKSDLRSKKSMVSTEMGRQVCRDIGATDYVECSALEMTNVDYVFQKAVHCTLQAWRKKKWGISCNIS